MPSEAQLKTSVLHDTSDPEFAAKLAKVMTSFDKRFEGFETAEALTEYMKRNAELEKQGKREMWVALENQAGEVVAFTNRQVSILQTGKGAAATTQDSYIFLDGAGLDAAQKREVAKQLYAAADAETSKFVASRTGGKTLPTYNFAVETSPLLANRSEVTLKREPGKHLQADLDRLAGAGFGRLEVRYLEPSYDKVNGQPEGVSYDQFAKLPEGVKTLPTEVYQAHLQANFDLAYPKGTSLNNAVLQPMKESIDRHAATGEIPVLPAAGHDSNLMSRISAELKNVPPGAARGQAVGELTPELRAMAADYYGDAITHYKDTLPQAAAQQGTAQQGTGSAQTKEGTTAPGSPADQLKNALAANDTTAIVAALAAGATATPAVMKLAASNPQILAALPPSVAAAISGGQTQQQDTGARVAQEAVAEVPAPAPARTTAEPAKGTTVAKPATGATQQPKAANAALAKAAQGLKLKPARISGGADAAVQAPGAVKTEDGKAIKLDDAGKKGAGR